MISNVRLNELNGLGSEFEVALSLLGQEVFSWSGYAGNGAEALIRAEAAYHEERQLDLEGEPAEAESAAAMGDGQNTS